MCGIVAAIAHREVVPILIEGLKRLEYRGYDSCGIAILTGPTNPSEAVQIKRVRSVSRVAHLQEQVDKEHIQSTIGIAHTRWATHGAPIADNAHPMVSHNSIALVHNGIIENHETLRAQLSALGYTFESQTDTEVIAHLIHSQYRGDLVSAVRKAVQQLHGAYAIAVLSTEEPDCIVGVRQGSPLVVGLAEGAHFIASDALALSGSTDRFIFLEEGDIFKITREGCTIQDAQGQVVHRQEKQVIGHGSAVELGPYRHFMQKEIFEQPQAIANTLPAVDMFSARHFGETAQDVFPHIDRILIVACGTSYYAGLTAKYWLESIAGIPTQVEVASEYRYRDSIAHPQALVVVISQSGETADTLSALKHAQSLGHEHTLAICNVSTSTMMRCVKWAFLTHAGIEIGVASTKAFTAQLVALFILTVSLAKSQQRLKAQQEASYVTALRHLPAAINSVLALEPYIIGWSEIFARKEHVLFVGRGLHYPIALEGALKLKETSYIHAEAYPAGELKHGPLALIDESMPVITIAPNDALLEKLKSNMQEVRARGGELYVFADADTRIANEKGVHVIRMPEHYGPLSPILHVVPLQLLAYHTACARGTDADKPRNLAKSVTVE